MSRSLRGPADIVFTPYNYLLDPKARKSYGIELAQNIVIFDEAHNLEQFCEETSSFSISSYDVSTALEAVDELINKLQNQVCTEEPRDSALLPYLRGTRARGNESKVASILV